ncbi:MAG: hypothetical protein M3Y07_15950, partial [Acidobacteriota bacterium]|nr:hypothetical protein [Acidobacteriota bacterium]
MPLFAFWVAFLVFGFGLKYNFDAVQFLQPYVTVVYLGQMALGMMAISAFFMLLGAKSGSTASLDDRRRLRVM